MFDKLLKRKEPPADTDRLAAVLEEEVPAHIAIIMDGNGRWAKMRGLPRIAGHHEGMKTVRRITKLASRMGVEVLTLYAFSTENWKRPKTEVDFLMRLPEEFLSSYLPELVEENVRVVMMGEQEKLPPHTKRAVQRAIHDTRDNTGLVLNFALNYGSRSEIADAVRELAAEVARGSLRPEDITEQHITNRLMTGNLPEPDLLIRTSGEVRLSNFMLWQLAYTEFWFTETLWPDFDSDSLMEAVENYQRRNRRYGGLKGDEAT